MKESDINTTNVTGAPLLKCLLLQFYTHALEIDKLSTKLEEEVYTRPIALASCQEVRLGLDDTVLCLWQIFFFSLAARSWKEYSERSFSGCPYGLMEIRPPGFLAAWLVVGRMRQ